MHYVMSDIHGDFDCFLAMLELIDLKPSDSLYVLGDVIDRGYRSIELLQYIMKMPNCTLLRGNHEKMMSDAYAGLNGFSLWRYNGGDTTEKQFEALEQTEKDEILEFLKNTPLFIKLTVNEKDFVLVHGDYPPDDSKKREDYYLWERMEDDTVFKDFTVVFGHTPTCNYQCREGFLEVFFGENKIGIDCGAAVHRLGQLACVRLDDLATFYINPMDVVDENECCEELLFERCTNPEFISESSIAFLNELNLEFYKSASIIELFNTYDSYFKGKIEVRCNICDYPVENILNEYIKVCDCKSVGVYSSLNKSYVVRKLTGHDFTFTMLDSGRIYRFKNNSFVPNRSFKEITTYLKESIKDRPIKRMELYGDYYSDNITSDSSLLLFVVLEDKNFPLDKYGKKIIRDLGINVVFYSMSDFEIFSHLRKTYERGNIIIKGE